MKKLITILILPALFFIASAASASTSLPLGEIDQTSGATTYEMMCDFRKMFCGTTAIVIISFVLFAVGLLIFQGKMSWGYVLVILTGIVIFVSANQLTKIMSNAPNNLGVITACEC